MRKRTRISKGRGNEHRRTREPQRERERETLCTCEQTNLRTAIRLTLAEPTYHFADGHCLPSYGPLLPQSVIAITESLAREPTATAAFSICLIAVISVAATVERERKKERVRCR